MNDWSDLPVFDIILMRNILSYFPRDTQITIYDKLFEHMHPETYLFLSAHEAPADGDRFFLLKSTEKDACYQLLPAEPEADPEEQKDDSTQSPEAETVEKSSAKEAQPAGKPALKPDVSQTATAPKAPKPATKAKPIAAAAPTPSPVKPSSVRARVHEIDEIDEIDDIEDLDDGLDEDDDMIEDV